MNYERKSQFSAFENEGDNLISMPMRGNGCTDEQMDRTKSIKNVIVIQNVYIVNPRSFLSGYCKRFDLERAWK